MDPNDDVDIYRTRRRRRFLAAIGVGALAAVLVALGLRMFDDARNPCERVRAHLCGAAPASPECGIWKGIEEESRSDGSPKMRGLVRAQCETRIERLAAEGIRVP